METERRDVLAPFSLRGRCWKTTTHYFCITKYENIAQYKCNSDDWSK